MLYFIVGTDFFLGEKGAVECVGGCPITDLEACEEGCIELELPITSDLIDGELCYQGFEAGGRKNKGCHQNGKNAKNAHLVCGPEKVFFLGEKGAVDCNDGVPVTDINTCEEGCFNLGLNITSDLIDGELCYQGFEARKNKGCHQNGKNAEHAHLVCEMSRKCIFSSFSYPPKHIK